MPEAVGNAEELEGAALAGPRGRGDQGEPWQALGRLDAVGGDGGQVGEQGGEAVHRLAIGGVFGGVLGQRRGRAAGGGDRAGPDGAGGGVRNSSPIKRCLCNNVWRKRDAAAPWASLNGATSSRTDLLLLSSRAKAVFPVEHASARTLRSIKAKDCVPGRCVDETQTVSPGENFGMCPILTSFAEAWV